MRGDTPQDGDVLALGAVFILLLAGSASPTPEKTELVDAYKGLSFDLYAAHPRGSDHHLGPHEHVRESGRLRRRHEDHPAGSELGEP